jgi:hypothetical protein
MINIVIHIVKHDYEYCVPASANALEYASM